MIVIKLYSVLSSNNERLHLSGTDDAPIYFGVTFAWSHPQVRGDRYE